jgi:hypothetical protein
MDFQWNVRQHSRESAELSSSSFASLLLVFDFLFFLLNSILEFLLKLSLSS